MKISKSVFIGSILGSLVMGAGLGVLMHLLLASNAGVHATFSELRTHTSAHERFTNPLLECSEGPQELLMGDRVVIERAVSAYVSDALAHHVISSAAVYFRDLNNGPWFGINERTPFTPGSLLKLPLAISLYALAQRDPTLLTSQVEYKGRTRAASEEADYGSDTPLSPGVYSVDDRLGKMLRTSNNDAAEILAQVIGKDNLLSIYQDLGIQEPEYNQDYVIDVKTFGAFFRILYNASYIGQQASERLLSTLAESTFHDGLVAGVPQTVTVAHKFGTRSLADTSVKQLHDCGIIYASKPYILCVMTQGSDMTKLATFIEAISHIVYSYVEK